MLTPDMIDNIRNTHTARRTANLALFTQRQRAEAEISRARCTIAALAVCNVVLLGTVLNLL